MAGPANGAVMIGKWHQKTKPNVTNRMACKALADCSVTLGDHGKFKRTISQTKRMCADDVQSAVRAMSPDNKIDGLELIEAGIVKRR